MKTLTGAQKAAIVLLAVGEDLAASLLQNLSQPEVRDVGKALAHLGTIDQRTVESVLQEFLQAMNLGIPLQPSAESSSSGFQVRV